MSEQLMDHDKKAILLVDFQEDFTEDKNGSLAVPGTDAAYIENVLTATRFFVRNGFPVYATQDWHPKNHVSFSINNPGTNPFNAVDINGRSQIMWPTHCVQETAGAKILIEEELLKGIIRKGTDPDFDSYSGFADDGGKETGLNRLLKSAGILELFIYGLATDFLC
jgi:nicotinamidase/pyrazinamidase